MPEEKQLIEHRSEVIREVMNKYIGSIEAVGETNTDGRRFSNLQVLEDVLYHIVEDIGKESLNTKRYEWSMKNSGEYAVSILEEIRANIDDILEESEKTMKLTYGQLSMIIFDIVYDDAADEVEDVESLMEYLNNNKDGYVEVVSL